METNPSLVFAPTVGGGQWSGVVRPEYFYSDFYYWE